MKKMGLLTPEQYADLFISDVEAEHLAKKGDFLHISIYQKKLAEAFGEAIGASLGQAIKTAKAAGADDELISHLEKHQP